MHGNVRSKNVFLLSRVPLSFALGGISLHHVRDLDAASATGMKHERSWLLGLLWTDVLWPSSFGLFRGGVLLLSGVGGDAPSDPWLSPEAQADRTLATRRNDVFMFGGLLYELLTGPWLS